MQVTTPLEREILAHYYCGVGPFRKGSENWGPSDSDAVERFLRIGLLTSGSKNGCATIEPNREALKVYMDALAAVPLPRQQWAIPS